MFNKPIFETLPVALIAAGILLVTFIHNPLSWFTGLVLVFGSCYIVYRRVNEISLSNDDQELTQTIWFIKNKWFSEASFIAGFFYAAR